MKKIMKRVAALFCAAMMMFSFAACALEDPEASSAEENSTQESSAPESEVSVEESAMEDSLKGLCEYLDAKGYLSDSSTEMAASMIGAKSGIRYSVSLNGTDNIKIELYEFDLNNLSKEAKAVIDSVKKNGTFTIVGLQAEGAMMSDSGKYMMVYTDSVDNEENAQREKNVKEAFAGFKK
ncbi:MAG: hypothetical protein ACLUUJ_02830 [Acutalibacteraceae bacterium]|nr:hypothetical protein [Bacillota bacterium]